jgi:holo-[acyl-carrier protein] synthase
MNIIGVGVDLTEVKRIKNAFDKWGKVFLERIFTSQEIECAKKHQAFYQHLAGRFAAKEAVFKALGDAQISWKDVEILNKEDGKPYCNLLNGKGKDLEIHLSISHIKNYALAQAIVIKKT